ncbi:hypothetical protein TUM20985_24070 [Mycobacterium antarcticum]|nr:hypothetical protein TUM20985_24070 [Mycolicibacterium sp. TUM20985]
MKGAGQLATDDEVADDWAEFARLTRSQLEQLHTLLERPSTLGYSTSIAVTLRSLLPDLARRLDSSLDAHVTDYLQRLQRVVAAALQV